MVPNGWGSRLENEKTIDYMRRYGWQGVRGGDYTNCRKGETWWLPPEFQANGVSKFGLPGLEMYCFCISAECPISCCNSVAVSFACGLEYPQNLNPDLLPNVPLGGSSDQLEHILALEPVAPAGAQ